MLFWHRQTPAHMPSCGRCTDELIDYVCRLEDLLADLADAGVAVHRVTLPRPAWIGLRGIGYMQFGAGDGVFLDYRYARTADWDQLLVLASGPLDRRRRLSLRVLAPLGAPRSVREVYRTLRTEGLSLRDAEEAARLVCLWTDRGQGPGP